MLAEGTSMKKATNILRLSTYCHDAYGTIGKSKILIAGKNALFILMVGVDQRKLAVEATKKSTMATSSPSQTSRVLFFSRTRWKRSSGANKRCERLYQAPFFKKLMMPKLGAPSTVNRISIVQTTKIRKFAMKMPLSRGLFLRSKPIPASNREKWQSHNKPMRFPPATLMMRVQVKSKKKIVARIMRCFMTTNRWRPSCT